MVEHAAAFGPNAGAAPGGELHDDPRADLANAFLELGEPVRVRRRRLVVVADVHVDERGTGFKRRMSRFDLLADRDRNGRVVLRARDRSWDGGCDDTGLRPPALHPLCIPSGTRDPGLGARDSGLGAWDSGLRTQDSGWGSTGTRILSRILSVGSWQLGVD